MTCKVCRLDKELLKNRRICLGCKNVWMKAYYQRNKERIREKVNRDYHDNIDIRRLQRSASAKRQYSKAPEKFLLRGKRNRLNLKIKVILALGGKCVCCDEANIEFLTLDHINGDGAEHRTVAGGNQNIYREST